MSFPPGYKKNFTLPEQYNEITGSLRWVNSNNVNMLYKYEATGCLHNVWISDHVLNVDLIFARPLPGSVWPYLILSLIFFAPLSTHPGWFTSICQNKQTKAPSSLHLYLTLRSPTPPSFPAFSPNVAQPRAVPVVAAITRLSFFSESICHHLCSRFPTSCCLVFPAPALTSEYFHPNFFLTYIFYFAFSLSEFLLHKRLSQKPVYVWIYLCLKVCLSTEALS